MLHGFMAAAVGNNLLRIDDAEAKLLASKIQKVTRHYDIPGISQEVQDWVGLAMALGTVYGPRISVVAMNRKPRPAANGAAQPAAQPAPAAGGKTVTIPGLGAVSVPAETMQ